ncbi:MAG: CDP-alcohol phosphatidyltransferase family protein [Bacteroidales bacterium]|nr:CDP-alcohol phosphatidyltransferase family protein [Bacteroidales bacterium]
MKKEEFWTIPNIITLYRLLMVPVILWFAIAKHETLFAVFLVINLVSDIIDGYVARRFKMETEIGARLDSFADNFNYLLAFLGMFIFKMDDLRPHLVSLFIYIGLLLLTQIISLIKFRRFPSFHPYMGKIGGYINGFFFFCLFTLGFFAPLYYLVIAWGILGAMEHIAIQMVIPEMRSNVKGLYWVLKEKANDKKQVE